MRRLLFVGILLSAIALVFAFSAEAQESIEEKDVLFNKGCNIGLVKLSKEEKLDIKDNSIWCIKLAKVAKADAIWNQVPVENFGHFGCWSAMFYASKEPNIKKINDLCTGV